MSRATRYNRLSEAGIQTAPPEANRNQVRVLLGGTEDEAITFLRRHSGNPGFLRIARDIETARTPQRPLILKLITALLTLNQESPQA